MDNGKIRIFVKVDLLLHEKDFDALRSYMSNSNGTLIEPYSSIDYSAENDCIVVSSLQEEANFPNMPNFMDSGYALMSINSLKKLISQ